MTSNINLNLNASCFNLILPDDLKPAFFGFLDKEGLSNAVLVCSTWKRFVCENSNFIEWKNQNYESGNEALRQGFEEYAEKILYKPLDGDFVEALKKTSDPIADRQKIVNYILKNDKYNLLSSTAFRTAAKHGSFHLCAAFLPSVINTCYIGQGIGVATQNGHVELVKKLSAYESRIKEKICIRVHYPTKEGEHLSLRGYIGSGSYDMNSWEKGLDMKRVCGRDHLWEIILFPVVYGENTIEYDPEKDNILFPFKPVLHLENGETLMAKEEYQIKPRTNITVAPEF